ncbi:hypothetical protein M0G43_04175 [Subsaxibacter sp. CAU 1640]|uniref:hypothetical protein n=1 Tax=Subsaxibacter sp. CAU 1640 TaxID=2933271 RepID=UPI002002A8D5|nr:hypothetical protein [Subsaxibacter sp. CAU 1640]MCK7589762.1 hypothetical protein [Subsaxibacter sp. CAU 1640]
MKKVLILIALITLPMITFGQNGNDTAKQNDSTIIENTTVKTKTENQTALSTAAKAQLNDLSYKKSNDLISIKAYRKSLQIKVKEIKNC